MKKRLLFLFCTFIFLGAIQAQNWCPPGATWHYRDINMNHENYKDGTLELKFTSTVTINNIVCKEIKGTFYGAVSYLYLHYDVIPNYVTYRTYENNNVVYIFNVASQAFDTIVDFNAHIGDSWNRCLYSSSCDILNIPHHKVTVYDTGHVTINGFYLKKLVISPPAATSQSVIIERIGGMPGYLFIAEDCNADGSTIGEFSCYADNSFPTYKKAGISDCNFNTVSIARNSLSNSSLSIYPNPNAGDFKIELPQPATVQIFNNLGAMVYTSDFENAGAFDIHFPAAAAGIYYLKASDQNGSSYLKIFKY